MLVDSNIVNCGALIKLIGGPVGIVVDHIVDEVSALVGNTNSIVYVVLVNGSRCRLIRESFEMLEVPTV